MRLNRKTLTDPNTNRKSYATEELITELAAVNLTHELKISTVDKLQNSAAYLESWVKTLKADKKILFKLLNIDFVFWIFYLSYDVPSF